MEDFQENQNLLLAMSNLESIKSKKRNITEETLPRQEEVLIQDKVRLGEAERELQRQKTLFEQGAVPAVDY
jgi:multidrug resistance efflux pump